MTASTDVVVIGSGFGGSIAANRLALAGRKVLLLERGPWRDSLPVRSMGIERRAPFPYGRSAITHLLRSVRWGRFNWTPNHGGLYELFCTPGLCVVATSSVGGGSIAYGGLLEPPRNSAYWYERHPGLDPASVERHYGKVLADMGATAFSSDLGLPQSVWTQMPASPERRCRPAEQQPHMGWLFPRSPDEAGRIVVSAAGVERQSCAFEGDGVLGSRGGAKASVDFIYLAPVLGRGATVRDLCEVTRIERARPVDGGGYLVHFTDRAARTSDVVRAAQVVLAAGTMNTLRLLFASAGAAEGLAPMPALGRTFGANGDVVGAWSRDGSGPSSFHGPPAMGAFAVAGYDAPSMGMGTLGGFDALPLPSWMKRRLARTYLLFGIGADSGRGSVGFRHGGPSVSYDAATETIYDDIHAAFRVLADENGGRIRTLKRPLTVHPWGGACLGASERGGVVDHRGEVYGNPGLFIADGSALPAAPGGPPSLAIAAWAHHVAGGLAGSADPPRL